MTEETSIFFLLKSGGHCFFDSTKLTRLYKRELNIVWFERSTNFTTEMNLKSVAVYSKSLVKKFDSATGFISLI